MFELVFVFAADVAAERSYYLQDSNKRVNMWPSARTVRPDLWAVTQLEAAAQTSSEILKTDKCKV